jgi:hypothetical protein
MRREFVAPLGPAEGELFARPARLRVEVPLEVRLPIREVVEQLGREVEQPPVAAPERQLDPVSAIRFTSPGSRSSSSGGNQPGTFQARGGGSLSG